MKRIVTAAFITFFSVTPMFAAVRTTTLKVPGMTCPACPITIKKVLKRVQGVTRVKVDYPQKKVMVTFDDAKTNVKALVKATSDIGFPSQPVERTK
jgi:mercuric ion binding protein